MADRFEDLIQQITKSLGVDTSLAKSIISVESAFNPWLTRYEPGWSYFYFPRETADRLLVTTATETAHQMTSWGLMQVMGSVARELGFLEEMPRLCLPANGIFYGCKLLKKLLDRYGSEQDAISAYNQGSPKKAASGFYLNERYVDQVNQYLRKYRPI